jgi:hypothetical protein
MCWVLCSSRRCCCSRCCCCCLRPSFVPSKGRRRPLLFPHHCGRCAVVGGAWSVMHCIVVPPFNYRHTIAVRVFLFSVTPVLIAFWVLVLFMCIALSSLPTAPFNVAMLSSIVSTFYPTTDHFCELVLFVGCGLVPVMHCILVPPTSTVSVCHCFCFCFNACNHGALTMLL